MQEVDQLRQENEALRKAWYSVMSTDLRQLSRSLDPNDPQAVRGAMSVPIDASRQKGHRQRGAAKKVTGNRPSDTDTATMYAIESLSQIINDARMQEVERLEQENEALRSDFASQQVSMSADIKYAKLERGQIQKQMEATAKQQIEAMQQQQQQHQDMQQQLKAMAEMVKTAIVKHGFSQASTLSAAQSPASSPIVPHSSTVESSLLNNNSNPSLAFLSPPTTPTGRGSIVAVDDLKGEDDPKGENDLKRTQKGARRGSIAHGKDYIDKEELFK
jgi:hypothetical protein